MRTCLSMIVKDEETVIERCLDSVLPYVDMAVICDTGSTDGTIAAIKRAAEKHGKPIRIRSCSWVNYAHNRNEALQIARRFLEDTDPASDSWQDDYIMVMDADDVMRAPSFAANHTLDFPDGADGYFATYRLGSLFQRPILIKAGVPWKYYFPVHEVLMRREDDVMDLPHSGLEVDCNVGCAYQGKEKFLHDAKMLEEYLAGPETFGKERCQFYLAQSYHCAGPEYKNEAIQHYAKRTTMGGYVEERVVSWLRMGELCGDPGAFLEAAALNHSRAEGLYGAAQWCQRAGLIPLALVLAQMAVAKQNPYGMFVEEAVYKWKAKKFLALLTRDKDLAMQVFQTPGAEYGSELLEIATQT